MDRESRGEEVEQNGEGLLEWLNRHRVVVDALLRPTHELIHVRAATPELTKQLNEMLNELLNGILDYMDEKGERIVEPFQTLPTREELPDYYHVISEPIDFDRIQQKIDTGRYNAIEDLNEDMVRLVNNAQIFNEEDSEIYASSKVIEKLWKDQYDKLMNPPKPEPPVKKEPPTPSTSSSRPSTSGGAGAAAQTPPKKEQKQESKGEEKKKDEEASSTSSESPPFKKKKEEEPASGRRKSRRTRRFSNDDDEEDDK